MLKYFERGKKKKKTDKTDASRTGGCCAWCCEQDIFIDYYGHTKTLCKWYVK